MKRAVDLIAAWVELQAIPGLKLQVCRLQERTPIGAQMVARKQLTVEGGGVFAPEGCLEPAHFIRAFAKKGLHIYDDVEMTTPVQP
jgi:hypothetical protein